MNPACEKCAFFVPGMYQHTGTCRKYTVIRGRLKIVHDFSDNVRLDPKRCGPHGKHFIPKAP